MVRKQNERTILLQYRIIQLSLPSKTLFLILASRPLSTRLGAFSSPETFPHKFFPKFFPIRPRRLFSVFLVRKIMGVEGTCRSGNRGGVLVLCSPYSMHPPFVPWSFPFLPTIRAKSIRNGANRVKVIFYLVCFGVFSGIWETERGKILIYF